MIIQPPPLVRNLDANSSTRSGTQELSPIFQHPILASCDSFEKESGQDKERNMSLEKKLEDLKLKEKLGIDWAYGCSCGVTGVARCVKHGDEQDEYWEYYQDKCHRGHYPMCKCVCSEETCSIPHCGCVCHRQNCSCVEWSRDYCSCECLRESAIKTIDVRCKDCTNQLQCVCLDCSLPLPLIDLILSFLD